MSEPLQVPIVSHIMNHSKESPDDLAIVHQDTTITYGQLGRKIMSASDLLLDMGIGRGTRVMLSATNDPAFIYGYFASHLVGAIAVPIDPQLTDSHRKYVADRVEPQALFVDRPFIYDQYPVENISALDRETSTQRNLTGGSLEDWADILFTTGTTGEPKGVVLTHQNVVSAAININTFVGNSSEDREVVPLPLSHSFGLGRLRCNMMAGGTIILVDGFMVPGKIFKSIEDWSATGFSFVPAGLALLYRFSGDKVSQYANQLKYIEIGSAPMPIEHKERLIKLLPETRICMHYGLTEASRAAFIEFHTSKDRLNSIGQASPNVAIKIQDDNGCKSPAGIEGEITVRGDIVMKEYLDNTVETNKRLNCGWLHTGDIGYEDKDGYIYLQGRTSELINVGGMKVSPSEIEDVLKKFEGIQDCACIGVPDPKGLSGEAVKAFIVPEADKDSKITQNELVIYLRGHVEPYKIPTLYEWVDSIPKTPSGKIQRQLLKG